jgi:hypothetical protein
MNTSAMKQLLLLIFFVFGVEATAQKIRFTDTSNRWKIESIVGMIGESCQELAIMKMGPDTTIHGLAYKMPQVLYYSRRCELANGGSWNTGGQAGAKITGGYYREDTILNRLYCRSTWPGDTAEYIIFDAGWRIGDTLNWGAGVSLVNKSIVVGYDSAFLNNSWHKVFRMAYAVSAGSGSGFDIVEGIGCTKGPGYPVHAVVPFENSDWLRCFEHSGQRPAFSLASGLYSGFNNTSSCNVAPLSVKPSITDAAVTVVPNPGGSLAILQMGKTIRSGKFWMANAEGKLITSFELLDKSEVPIGQFVFSPGIYFYSLYDNIGGQRFTGSFIFR